MAGVIIAPWLEEKPADFVNAARAGAEVGTQIRGQNLENAARMAAIAQQGADAGLRAQEAHERNQIASEVAKNRMALQTQNAANLLQQQRQRQMAIDGGMDPVQAWLQFPGTTSGSPGAGAFSALSQERRASLPLEPVPDPNNPGKVAGFHDGSKFYPLPAAKANANTLDPKDKIAIDALTKQYQNAMAGVAKFAGINDSMAGGSRKVALQAQQALQKYGVDMTGKSSAAAAPSAPSGPPGPPQKGQVVNGHTFLGGDPADKNSWQEVNPEGSSFMGTPGQPNEAELPGGMQDNQPVPDEDEEQ